MKNRKNYKLYAGIGIFCFIYILIAFKPLGTDLHLTPDWNISITRPEQGNEENEELIPFKLGQSVGYFTEGGKLASCTTYNFNAAISSSYYATYNSNNTASTVYSSAGKEVTTLNVPGFPHFSEDRIFVFMPGGTSFAQYSKDGDKIWEYESYAPVTSFASTEGGTVAGFADGEIVSFKSNGAIDQLYYPGGSQISVILGAGISEDGQYIGCVSGQKKQRFIVSKKNGEHSKIIFHEYLPEDTNRQTMVKFNKKATCVYYNYKDGIGVVDLKNCKSYHIEQKGIITQIEESLEDGLIYILSKDGENYTLTIIEPFAQVLSRTSFKARSAFIQIRGNKVFMGRDESISRMTVTRK